MTIRLSNQNKIFIKNDLKKFWILCSNESYLWICRICSCRLHLRVEEVLWVRWTPSCLVRRVFNVRNVVQYHRRLAKLHKSNSNVAIRCKNSLLFRNDRFPANIYLSIQLGLANHCNGVDTRIPRSRSILFNDTRRHLILIYWCSRSVMYLNVHSAIKSPAEFAEIRSSMASIEIVIDLCEFSTLMWHALNTFAIIMILWHLLSI